MRMLERRLEAVEAKLAPRPSANRRLFFLHPGTDPVAFEKQCEIDAAGGEFMIIRFVAAMGTAGPGPTITAWKGSRVKAFDKPGAVQSLSKAPRAALLTSSSTT